MYMHSIWALLFCPPPPPLSVSLNSDTISMILNVCHAITCLHASQPHLSPQHRLSPSQASFSRFHLFFCSWLNLSIWTGEAGRLATKWGVEGGSVEWNGEDGGRERRWGGGDKKKGVKKKIVTDTHLTQAVEWEQPGLSNLCANSE